MIFFPGLSKIPSADWVTTISYFSSSSEKYIHIEFAKPPNQYNFSNFIVKLIEVDVNGHEIRIVDDTVTSIVSCSLFCVTFFLYSPNSKGYVSYIHHLASIALSVRP
jgi:hypothetical protein